MKQLKVWRKETVKHVVTVATDFLKILFVSSGTLFSKCGNVRQASSNHGGRFDVEIHQLFADQSL